MNDYIIIAHRGITKYYNDNSLESLLEIKNIKSKNKLGIEFDVQITKDNEIILYHDEFLNNKKINDLDYYEVKKIDNKIIRLEELLKHYNKTTYLLDIEIKNYESDDIKIYINKLISIVDKYEINYFYSSFSIEIVEFLKTRKKNVCYISENLNDKSTEITSYNLFDKFDNIKGVYTLYDINFNQDIISKIVKNKHIKYLITDNVEMLVKYINKMKAN